MPPKTTTQQSRKLGATIREARAARGLSVRDLADEIGMNFSWVSYLEAGRVHRPAITALKQLSRALDISPGALFELAGYASRDTLPDLRDYLRLKYRLRPEAIDEVAQCFDAVRLTSKGAAR